MRRLAVLALALLASWCAHAASFEQECESKLAPTSVVVQSYPSDVQYDFTRGTLELTAASQKERRAGEFVLGVTERAFKMRMTWNIQLLTRPDGYACTRPQLVVDVWAGPQTVSIAREFEQGSCAFNEIAIHELRHVYANQKQVEYVADTMEQEMRASLGNRVFYGSPTELRDALKRHLQEEWMAWGMQRFEEVANAHAQIDTPQEYARNNQICGGIVPRVTKALTQR